MPAYANICTNIIVFPLNDSLIKYMICLKLKYSLRNLEFPQKYKFHFSSTSNIQLKTKSMHYL